LYTYTDNIGNLTVDTTASLVSVEFDDTNHNKYTITKFITNPSSYELQELVLYFNLPEDAILVEDLEVINSSIVQEIESLQPGENITITYTFYTYNDYDNNQQSALMTTIVPPAPPAPITGLVIFEEGQEGRTPNPVITGIIWSLVIIASISYFQKDNIVRLYNKAKEEMFKEDEPNMIEIKIEKE
jgi:hypothetical protein